MNQVNQEAPPKINAMPNLKDNISPPDTQPEIKTPEEATDDIMEIFRKAKMNSQA